MFLFRRVNVTNFTTVCSTLKSQSFYLLSALPYPTGGVSSITALASYLPQFAVFGDLSSTISSFGGISTVQPSTVYQQSGANVDNYRQSTFQCTNLTRSLAIQILYTNTGSFAQPAPAILGVAYEFGTQETLTYNFESHNDAVQFVEMTVSVNFVNASLPNSVSKAGLPQNAPVQPNWSDFFYPLYVESYVQQILGVS